MSAATRYPYAGEAATGERIARALHRVVDPEMAIDIVELGLVYGVAARDRKVDVRITMTSAACPVTEHIVEEVGAELRRELGDDLAVHVEVVWDPPWQPEMLSERARQALDWD
jgi:metal-sulfur cluster biosynthetic enzyme